MNKFVLVVDDEPVVANLIARQIAADGYQVDIAGDGVEAVLKYIQKDYEFVVLDIAMPRLKGSDALRIMKVVKPHVPVVTVTGQVGRGEMAETVESGALVLTRVEDRHSISCMDEEAGDSYRVVGG